MARKGIEQSFIESSTGWDDIDVLAIQLYECKLKPQMFGTKIAELYDGCDVALMLNDNYIQLSKDDLPELVYDISLTLTLREEEYHA